MKLPEIVMVPVDKISTNPFRDLQTYPVVKEKVDALMASFKTVGIWPSIIGRRMAHDGYVQQAFGHQRMHAAREMGLKEVPVIVMNLTDEQMVQYMGRENGEDYSADFLIMLNTWEAGFKYYERWRITHMLKEDKRAQNVQALDIAHVLGWTRQDDRRSDPRMNDVALACAGASTLIQGGYLDRKDLEGLSVRNARDIVTRALTRMESIERSAKLSGAPAKDVEKAKTIVGKGTKQTTKDARSGNYPAKQLGARVDINTMNAAGMSKGKRIPLFETFGRALVDSIAKTLENDAMAEKLAAIVKVLDRVVDESDKVVLRQLDFQLGELSNRSGRWRKRLTADKVRKFPAPVQIGGPDNG